MAKCLMPHYLDDFNVSNNTSRICARFKQDSGLISGLISAQIEIAGKKSKSAVPKHRQK